MSIYNRVKATLKQNKQNRLEGKLNCIPWSFKRLTRALPGVQKKRYVGVTANSKVGKSQITDYLFVLEPFEFIMNNLDTNVKLKIFYFSLEISKEEKLMTFLSYKIYKDTGRVIDPLKLQSVFNDYILDNEVEALLDKYDEWFTKFEQTVEIIDSTRNPYGIYSTVRDYMLTNGKLHKKKIMIDNVEVEVEDYYEPNNPDEYVIVICDHISLLTPEKGEDLRTAMGRFSSNYCMKLRDRFGCCVVNVHQQSASSEELFFTTKGDIVIDKLKPSASDLGDNKTVSRDYDLLLGLFAPARYKIKSYNQYDITKFNDNYRELSIIFNRKGVGNASVDLFFNGACNYFQELPEPLEFSKNPALYNKYLKK
jgi:hypothetical protein